MQTLTLDLISDIVCPWCVIGYKRLERAMASLEGELAFDLDWHPFELNPDLPAGGEPLGEHLTRKYGGGPAERARNRELITGFGAELGFEFRLDDARRIYNTFDAHRVLAWAREQDRATELHLALFRAYFTDGDDPADPAVLRAAAAVVGLDPAGVDLILGSKRYAAEVRDEEAHFLHAGVRAVPACIVNERYLISGAQTPETFVAAFRKIAAETA